MAEVVILGAGLTGLSAAYHLEQQAFFDFKIFEQNSHPGGLLRSFIQDGFTFDLTGHWLHISNKYFYDFLNNTSDIKKFDYINRNSAIYSCQTFTPYPYQINLAGLPSQIITDNILSFINRKKEIKKPKNFNEWVLKYFGYQIGKNFFFPYNGKLLSYDTKKITPSWTGRFVPQTDLKKMLAGALKKSEPENIGYNNSFYYPKKGGIQFIIDNLTKNLKTKINTDHQAISIDTKNKIIIFNNGHQEHFEKLITTIPLNNLLKNFNEKSDTNLKRLSSKFICNSVINFNIGFDTEKLVDKHWVYFPEKKFNFYRIGFWGDISKSSVKNGTNAIYGEVSYIPGKLSGKQIQNLTNNAINDSLKFLNKTKANIVTEKNFIIPHAYVIYDFWREKNLNKIHKKLNELSIYSIGRYGEWKYSSMQEAVLDGMKAALQILER